MGPAAVPIVMGVIAAGTAVQQHQQKQESLGQAKWAQRVQRRQIAQAKQEAKDRERLDEVQRIRAAARADQLRRRASAAGYSPTLATSALGTPMAGKTQLGT
jgi:hypothetical protein